MVPLLLGKINFFLSLLLSFLVIRFLTQTDNQEVVLWQGALYFASFINYLEGGVTGYIIRYFTIELADVVKSFLAMVFFLLVICIAGAFYFKNLELYLAIYFLLLMALNISTAIFRSQNEITLAHTIQSLVYLSTLFSLFLIQKNAYNFAFAYIGTTAFVSLVSFTLLLNKKFIPISALNLFAKGSLSSLLKIFYSSKDFLAHNIITNLILTFEMAFVFKLGLLSTEDMLLYIVTFKLVEVLRTLYILQDNNIITIFKEKDLQVLFQIISKPLIIGIYYTVFLLFFAKLATGIWIPKFNFSFKFFIPILITYLSYIVLHAISFWHQAQENIRSLNNLLLIRVLLACVLCIFLNFELISFSQYLYLNALCLLCLITWRTYATFGKNLIYKKITPDFKAIFLLVIQTILFQVYPQNITGIILACFSLAIASMFVYWSFYKENKLVDSNV